MLKTRHASGGRPLDRHALESWRRSPRGRRLLQIESQELARFLPDVFGRHVLQIGSWGSGSALIASAGTLHHAVLGTAGDSAVAAVVDPQALPLPAKSVDAIVLPHTLEFSPSPHDVLREVDRVLNDRGRLFVLGFSPWGAWSWRARLGLRHRAFPRGARFYSAGRVHDWLELLGFDVTEVRRYSVGFPWLASRAVGEPWSPASLLAPLSEAYLICARKRVLPMNFVGRVQRAQVKPLVGVGLPAAQRGMSQNESGTTV
ncbi:Methyltransferase domain-containing protein [Fontimonas thermophila]|uniref:Methyltransferase domain-containing protein n=2 Tax=Fontimonas thermophila TaxID=1076937 RepID=A0A1I2IMC6_9GAMM|nr:Methyltransferase domain-containing protein [Fontimonas thermophila]